MAYYGYHRISTKEQHLDRGIIEIKRFCENHEYSNAIVHAFQGFRAPFSGKIVHIFPEQSAAFN